MRCNTTFSAATFPGAVQHDRGRGVILRAVSMLRKGGRGGIERLRATRVAPDAGS